MIIGTMDKCEKYYKMGENVKQAFEWLKANDIRKMEAGRYEDKNGMYILVQRYTTKDADSSWFEGHLKYLDLHFVAEGYEYFGYAPIARSGEPIKEYNAEADEVDYRRVPESFILLRENDWVIVFPEDIHMPQRQALFPSNVIKACIKIPIAAEDL
jgi:YhcH/YjgK/YiaL family protein